MPDTVRTHAEILALLGNNAVGAISAQDLRDAYVTLAEGIGGIVVLPATGDRGSAINSAIDTAYATYLATGRPQLVRLLAGRYDITTRILVKSFVRLRGAGLGVTELVWTGAAGDPALYTNAMVKALGAVTAKMATTPTNTANGGVVKTRNTAAADGYVLGVVGAAVHMGLVDLNYAAFNGGWVESDTRIIDCMVPGGVGSEDCSYWWHDTFMCNISNVSILNRGKSPYQVIDGLARVMQGVRTQDQEGQWSGLHTQGVEYAFRHNSSLGISLRNVLIRSAPSAGTTTVIGFYLDNPATHEMRSVEGCEATSIYFGAGFDGLNSNTVWSNLVLNDTWFTSFMVVGRNRTGGVRGGGDIGAFDKSITTGERAVVATNHAQAAGMCLFVNGPNGFGAPDNGWTLVMPLPGTGTVNLDAAVAGNGVSLYPVGGGSFLASATVAGTRIGQNLRYKGAGAASVKIGP